MAGAREERTHAARLFGAAETLREAIGAPLPPVDRPGYDRSVIASRAQGAWEAAWKQGRAMSAEEAVEYALSGEQPEQHHVALGPGELPTGKPPGDLTLREQEITLLVAQGLTNRQISTRLSISERTSGNHVARILKKLELRSRAQIATWVTETQLPKSRPDQG